MTFIINMSLRSDDKMEDLIKVEIERPSDNYQRVHVFVGANAYHMDMTQFKIMTEAMVQAYVQEKRRQGDVVKVTSLDVAVGDALELKDSVGGK